MTLKNADNAPRERLLNEAEALFAKKGYHAVSVREITKAADCNLAAVNYHFGNKKNLYMEVFRTRWLARAGRIQERIKKVISAEESFTPQTLIRAVAEAFLEGPLSDEERQFHFQLMVKELTQPTEAFELVVDQVMKPFIAELGVLLRPFFREDLENELLTLKILSIFAVTIHLNFAREAVTSITGRTYDSSFRERLVDHITQFSLNGLGIDGRKEDKS